MKWYLETERLRLRAIDDTDAQNLFELNSDPDVMKYLSPEYNSLAGAAEILPKVVARNQRYNNRLGLFAAIHKGNGDFIGWFILRPDHRSPDDTTNLEIGYRLKKKYWGQGFGSEASYALVEIARKEYSVRRIYAEAMPGNKASTRIMEKIGLTFEKSFTETEPDGSVIDLVLYSKSY